MSDFLRLAVTFLAAINPAAVALAGAQRGFGRERRLPWAWVAIAGAIAAALYLLAALLAEKLLDGLLIEPESFRIAAGVVMLIGGVQAVWWAGPRVPGEETGWLLALFPLAVPLLVTPAGLAAAVSHAADDGAGVTIGGMAVGLGVALVLLLARLPQRAIPACDAIARITGALLIALAAGLMVSGVRDI